MKNIILTIMCLLFSVAMFGQQNPNTTTNMPSISYNKNGLKYWANGTTGYVPIVRGDTIAWVNPAALITGSTSQTLYHNGTAWTATSNLWHNGTDVSIGIASALGKLYSYKSDNTAYANAVPTMSTNQFNLANPSANASVYAGIGFLLSGNSFNRIGYIGAVKESTSTGGLSLVFCTDLDASTRLEKMAIKGNGQIGMGTFTPAASALLDITSTVKGFLPPRMTASQRVAIPSPATGLMVYGTTANKLYVYNGTAWRALVDSVTLAGYLPLSGGTMTGNILFTDNTYDIGASGATRPRAGYFGTSLVAPTINATTALQVGGVSTDLIYHKQGGNSFTAAATLGTNDAYALNLETSNTTRATFHATDGSLKLTAAASATSISGLTLRFDKATAGTDDDEYRLDFNLDDDGGNETTFGRMVAVASNAANGAEDGWLDYYVAVAGTLTRRLSVTTGGATVLGELDVTGPLDLAGGVQLDVAGKATTYTTTEDDHVIEANAASGAFSILLDATPQSGQEHTVTKSDSSGNAVTLDGNGLNINGAATVSLSAQYNSRTVVYNGTEWRVRASN